MCELLGMSFNLPVDPNISFRGFRYRSKKNPHGWGLAFYPDESAHVIKEPIKAVESLLSKFLKDYPEVKSKLFIAHVRRGSSGSSIYKNTHPFQRELDGKEYVFAHNGTLQKYGNLETGRFKSIGETDSEYAFCHLLNCIEERGITHWAREDFEWLAGKLKEINKYGTFNCILSDCEFLFCYHDKDGYNGLCFIHRKPPYGRIRLLDEDWDINLARKKDPNQTGFIIATRRLTDEPWESFRFGELIVLKDGRIVYSNFRDVSEVHSTSFTDLELKIFKILRESLHRLSMREIIIKSESSATKVKSSIHALLCRGYIHQDSRDSVKWNHDDATFYTNPSKREKIDKSIK